jgi:hypothetical protein
MATRKVPRLLWEEAGGRCSMCKKKLGKDWQNSAGKAFALQIVSGKKRHGRYVAFEGFDYKDVDNLLLLCKVHFDEADLTNTSSIYTFRSLKFKSERKNGKGF